MTKNILFVSILFFLFSCTSNTTKTEEAVVVEVTTEKIISLEFASKNPKANKEGTNVMISEMLHFSLEDKTQNEFVGFLLTLNNTQEGALNFSTRNDSVFCTSPSSLMLMSMPPKPGISPAMIETNQEFFLNNMSLLKFESVNIMFVGLGE